MRYLICKDEKQESEILKVLGELATGCEGLGTFEALVRQEEYGLNEFPLVSFDWDFVTCVLRDGQWAELPSVELVPGDIIKLAKNDITPADVILITGECLHVDEAIFTDKFTPGVKHLLEKVYAGSLILSGEATAVVGQTGVNTLLNNVVSTYNGLNNQLYLS